MNSLTIQVLILIASFLFYRVLKSGFDSWQAVLIDFGVVAFLFGLQYFLQKQNNTRFPAGELSRFFGASFPDKISFGEEHQKPAQKTVQLPQRVILFIQPKEEIYLEGNQKMILPIKIGEQDNNTQEKESVKIQNSGLYLLQFSLLSDKTSYHAKLSITGSRNNIEKSVHYGENCFIMQLNSDNIHFEIENGIHPAMILSSSSIYLVQL